MQGSSKRYVLSWWMWRFSPTWDTSWQRTRRVRKSLSKPHEVDERTMQREFLSYKGSDLLHRLYNIDGLVPANDRDYDPVREAVNLLGAR
jgi:ABC-type phosphate/phosphonate transport system substrate-binding protein